MTNNQILSSLRFTFDYDDDTMMRLYALGGYEATRTEVCSWLKKDDAEDFLKLNDEKLATFLNGWIVSLRGKKEGVTMIPEKKLNNNLIFRKLRIALNYKDDDILDVLKLANFKMNKPELNAFFRAPGHKHYRECKDQVLRNFLMGLKLKHKNQAV